MGRKSLTVRGFAVHGRRSNRQTHSDVELRIRYAHVPLLEPVNDAPAKFLAIFGGAEDELYFSVSRVHPVVRDFGGVTRIHEQAATFVEYELPASSRAPAFVCRSDQAIEIVHARYDGTRPQCFGFLAGSLGLFHCRWGLLG
jgi:hypothetical protein